MLTREELRELRRIEIVTNRLVNDQLAGSYHSVFKGRGMSFDEVRLYQPGDEIRFIDWNVSARTGELHVKRFVEERELTVMILVDMSGSLDFGTRKEPKRKVAAKVAALLAFSAIKNNDRIGLVLFTDRIERFVPPKKGRKHVLRVVSEIIGFEPDPAHRGTNVGVALEYLLRIAKRRAVSFLITDYTADGYDKQLRIAASRHDLVPILLTDALEEELPNLGMVHLEDPETGRVRIAPTHLGWFRRRFRKQAKIDFTAVEDRFKKMKMDLITLRTGDSYSKPLLNYFRLRSRRY
ncbi:MAG: hypothetical protein AMXMBFR64_35260 [Myxococcales bacterium]